MASMSWGQTQVESFHSAIPKTWDDAEIASLEVPLADPVGSPRHVSTDYYYKIPVRPIFKQYPVYAPGREPKGYMEWLKRQEPQIIWDDRGRKPILDTKADWIRAGEIVFDSPISFNLTTEILRSRTYGILPGMQPQKHLLTVWDGCLSIAMSSGKEVRWTLDPFLARCATPESCRMEPRFEALKATSHSKLF